MCMEKINKIFAEQLIKQLKPFVEEQNGKQYIGGMRIEGIILSISNAFNETINIVKINEFSGDGMTLIDVGKKFYDIFYYKNKDELTN